MEKSLTVGLTGIIPVFLYGNQTAMKYFALYVMAFVLFSCTAQEVVYEDGRNLSDDEQLSEHHNDSQKDSTEVNTGDGSYGKGTVYITGIEYPPGYDWKSSVEPEGTEALLFLMADGERVVDFLVGEKHCIYADPKRHICIKGHVYSDFNIDGKTIVKKDGETLFVYDEEEIIISWAVIGGDVYTLGERKPSGVALRKNGILLYDSTSGKALSGLYEAGGSVGFCAGEKAAQRCVFDIYSDGVIERKFCDEKLDSVIVAEQRYGKLSYVGYSSVSDEYILYSDGKETVLERFRYDYIAAIKFLRGDRKLFVYGELSDDNDNLCSPAVWTESGLFFNFSSYEKSFSVCTDADTVYNFVGKQQYPQPISAYKNREEKIFEYGSGLSVYSDKASVVADGKLYFIYQKYRPYLRPCISVDGVETEYGFNGFFSGVSFW